MLEDNTRTFADHWYGTGEISDAGDAEEVCLEAGEYMISEVVYTEVRHVELLQNEYAAGDTVALKYRDGATEGACLDAAWIAYAAPFESLGYVQVRMESTL